MKGVIKTMAMITDIKISFQSDNEKIKIIALTGKIGSGIDVIKSYLLRHKRVSPIIPAHAGSEELSSNEFLEKIVKGQIIEAYCNEENEIYGTDISQMLSTCLYVGIYTPNQIANMAECPNIELLPIEIDMNAEARFLHLLGYPHKEELTYKQLEEQEITNICKKFLKDNQYDNEDIENLDVFHYHLASYSELRSALEDSSFKYALKEFNATYGLISNLDNFI